MVEGACGYITLALDDGGEHVFSGGFDWIGVEVVIVSDVEVIHGVGSLYYLVFCDEVANHGFMVDQKIYSVGGEGAGVGRVGVSTLF